MDDVFAVAGTAAAAAGLAEVPGDQQLPALQSLLSRAAEALAGSSCPTLNQGMEVDGGTSDGGGEKMVLKAAKAALAAVAAVGKRAAAEAAAAADVDDERVAAAQSTLRHAAVLLLQHVLADKRTKKLAKAAVAVALSCDWHPLLAVLSSSPEVASALGSSSAAVAGAATADVPAASSSKRRKKKQDASDTATASSEGVKGAGGPLALNRAVVDALASAVAVGPGPSLLPELTSWAADGTSGQCCQHLVVLVLIRAAAVAAAAAQAAPDAGGTGGTVSPDVPPPTPSRGRGKGKQQQQQGHGSGQDGPAAAALPNIAAALVTLLERALAPAAEPGSSSSKKGKHKATPAQAADAQLPGNWAELAAELLDAGSLPTKKHLQQMHGELQQMNMVLLLAGVQSVLAAATADSLVHVLGQPAVVFSQLAAAAVQGHLPLLEHLHLIAVTAGPGHQQQLDFLAGIYGLPLVSRNGRAARGAEAGQAAALQLLCWQPGSGSSTCCVAAAASSESAMLAAGCSSSWFLQLLAAIDSSSKMVRTAAVDALFVLPELVGSSTSWQLAGDFATAHLQQLVSGLRVHEALLRDSAGVVSSLLCSAAQSGDQRAAAMEIEGSSGGRSGRSSSKAKHGKAGAGRNEEAGDASTAAELQLPADCIQALLQLLVAVLPQLHAPSQLLAAQLSAAVLSAAATAGGVAAGAAAAAADQLLQQLVVGLCSGAAPDARSSKKCSRHQPVWQQLTETQGGPGAVAEAHAVQQQLGVAVAVALTGFVNVAALQAEDSAVAGAIVEGFVSLLQLGSADSDLAAAASSQQAGGLSDSQLAVMGPVRAAALQQLDAAVFEALPSAQQQTVFSVILLASATDGDSSCRTAARSALERIPVTADMLLMLFSRVGSSSNQKQQQQHHKTLKRQKRASSSQGKEIETDEAAASLPVLASDLDSATAALELLMWKDDVADVQQLVQPLQQLLRLLVPVMGSIAESHLGSAVEQQQGGGEAAAAGAGVASASAAGYAASLVLLVLRQLAEEQLQQAVEGATAGRGRSHGAAAGPAGIDAELVLSCAAAAPDGAVRNAALRLLTVLAQVAPQDMLAHVLQVRWQRALACTCHA
jgi:hypothetical protein